jgi:hypothetical protein
MKENTAKKGRDGKNDTRRRVYYQMDYNGVSILIFIFKNRTYYKTSAVFHWSEKFRTSVFERTKIIQYSVTFTYCVT